MPEAVLFRDLLCPTCGYDLRGSPSLRCPECGTQSSQSAWSSRIPWVHRRAHAHRIGPFRAYFATVFFLLRHPFIFGRQIHTRVPRRLARRFHRISLALTLPIGLLIALGFYYLQHADLIYSPSVPGLKVPAAWFFWPLSACLDPRVYFIALPLIVFLSALAVSWLLRTSISLRAGDHSQRRRAFRLAYFLSALLPIQAALFGLAWLFHRANAVEIPTDLLKSIQHAAPLAAAISLALGLLLLLLPPLFLIWAKPTQRITRLAIVTVAFPVAAAMELLALGLTSLWLAGYLAMALWSMAH